MSSALPQQPSINLEAETAADRTWAEVLVNGNVSGGTDPIVSAGDTMILGDGTASQVLSSRKGAASTSSYEFLIGVALTNGAHRLIHQADETFDFQTRIGGAWADVWGVGLAGSVTFGFNVTLDSASPVFSLGDATGSPAAISNKADAGTSTQTFRTVAGADTALDKRFLHDTDETFAVQNYDGAAYQTAILVVSEIDIRFPAPNAAVEIGDATGNVALRVQKGAGSSGEVQFLLATSASLGAKRFLHTTGELLQLQHHNGAGYVTAMQVGATDEVDFKRVTMELGTTLLTSDSALSAGWGATAAVTATTGTDGATLIEVTAAGAGQAANPTITVTFTDGAWDVAPIGMASRADVAGAAGDFRVTATTTTTATITFVGTPVATEVYEVNLMFIGGGST